VPCLLPRLLAEGVAEAVDKRTDVGQVEEPEPANAWREDTDDVEGVISTRTGLIILKHKHNSALVDVDVPCYVGRILPLEDINLGPTPWHAARKVSAGKEEELELLKLAEVALAVAVAPLVLALQPPSPRPAEELLEGVMEAIRRLL
jgi:hypothetical protein